MRPWTDGLPASWSLPSVADDIDGKNPVHLAMVSALSDICCSSRDSAARPLTEDLRRVFFNESPAPPQRQTGRLGAPEDHGCITSSSWSTIRVSSGEEELHAGQSMWPAAELADYREKKVFFQAIASSSTLAQSVPWAHGTWKSVGCPNIAGNSGEDVHSHV